MQTSETNKKFNSIAQMLMQLAIGDFSFRIDAEKNSIESKLNGLATELQSNYKIAVKSNTYFSFKGLAQEIIIIDNNHVIKGFTSNFAAKLAYNTTKLQGMPIAKILAPQSIQITDYLKSKAKNTPTVVQLLLLTSTNQIISLPCLISDIHGTTDLIITSITIDWKSKVIVTDILSDAKEHASDEDIPIKLNKYILENLGKPLPRINQLCRIIGTNEFTLKDTFKKQYNTSIYQFYNNERLKRAHLLIQQTTLALKDIAFKSGFSDYTNFYKAFKKKYNYTPNQLFRKLEQ